MFAYLQIKKNFSGIHSQGSDECWKQAYKNYRDNYAVTNFITPHPAQ